MATLPRHSEAIEEKIDWSKGSFPGDRMNALMREGKVQEAQEELERLLLEGLHSGPPRIMNQELFDEIVAKARSGWQRPVR